MILGLSAVGIFWRYENLAPFIVVDYRMGSWTVLSFGSDHPQMIPMGRGTQGHPALGGNLGIMGNPNRELYSLNIDYNCVKNNVKNTHAVVNWRSHNVYNRFLKQDTNTWL